MKIYIFLRETQRENPPEADFLLEILIFYEENVIFQDEKSEKIDFLKFFSKIVFLVLKILDFRNFRKFGKSHIFFLQNS